MSDYLMVPVKYSVLNVTNKNERMIYIPVATTETPGIVRIGNGLKIDYYGLLSLSDDVESFIEKVNAGDIVSKGFYQYRADFKYPKNSVVFYNKEFYVSLVDENDAAITDLSKWSSVGIRSQLDAKEVYLSTGKNVESAINGILNDKVDKVSAPFYIDNTQEKVEMSYAPNRGSSSVGTTNKASISIDENNIIIEKKLGPTGRANTAKLIFGTDRPVLSIDNETETLNSPLAVLNDTINKQDKKPDGQTDLINAQTGKLDNAYLPDIISGTSRKFAGTFGEDGIIVASAYASEVNGQLITEINLADCVGYEFGYTGENPFMFDDIQVNKNDLIVCNGEQEPNWTLYDNSDKVVSVNGQTGAVQLDFVKDTDYATRDKGGVVKVNETYGTRIVDGVLDVMPAQNSIIDNRTPNEYPLYLVNNFTRHGIVPANIDYAVKKSLADNKLIGTNMAWTEEEKASARELLGISAGGIQQLVGTEEKPINFGTDMIEGELYKVIGFVRHNATLTQNLTEQILAFRTKDKFSNPTVILYDARIDYNSSLITREIGTELKISLNDEGHVATTLHLLRLTSLNGKSYMHDIYAPSESGTSGQILKSNGFGFAPSWITPNFATLDDITNAINGMWEESY